MAPRGRKSQEITSSSRILLSFIGLASFLSALLMFSQEVSWWKRGWKREMLGDDRDDIGLSELEEWINHEVEWKEPNEALHIQLPDIKANHLEFLEPKIRRGGRDHKSDRDNDSEQKDTENLDGVSEEMIDPPSLSSDFQSFHAPAEDGPFSKSIVQVQPQKNNLWAGCDEASDCVSDPRYGPRFLEKNYVCCSKKKFCSFLVSDCPPPLGVCETCSAHSSDVSVREEVYRGKDHCAQGTMQGSIMGSSNIGNGMSGFWQNLGLAVVGGAKFKGGGGGGFLASLPTSWSPPATWKGWTKKAKTACFCSHSDYPHQCVGAWTEAKGIIREFIDKAMEASGLKKKVLEDTQEGEVASSSVLPP